LKLTDVTEIIALRTCDFESTSSELVRLDPKELCVWVLQDF
jgi:hypothetical protein